MFLRFMFVGKNISKHFVLTFARLLMWYQCLRLCCEDYTPINHEFFFLLEVGLALEQTFLGILGVNIHSILGDKAGICNYHLKSV